MAPGKRKRPSDVPGSTEQQGCHSKHRPTDTGLLIFDIGANCGQSSELYLEAGHRVVAVEPNPVVAGVLRERLAGDLKSGRLDLVEKAIWLPDAAARITLYVNEEDSEWTSVFRECGERFGTDARPVEVETTTLKTLYHDHGVPHYVKIDVEGADGICLRQLKGLAPPKYLSYELNSLTWLREVAELGYSSFKIVSQSKHQAEHLLDEHDRPLSHAGTFGEDVVGSGGQGEWRSLEATLEDCKSLLLVHDANADVGDFVAASPVFVDRDFATLRACFPVESRNDEDWYDIHCRHSSVEKAA